ncbi:ROK family protein [Microbacterium sp. SORGH_AS_0888]|uniref:ROK family protein n=1 Tax=Microbacterium sp. SORGH_AS_0888 TaxID=3041791 RepID=UPI00277D7B08|nr:ROK family protein [Microbacterium sp. SORGH_AS_0888]MDQ1131288.1 glucokinase [Microbacterium sp. SORGH_AS_0888]
MRIGLDVGGTKTDAVAVAEDGTVAARVRRPTAWGPEGVVDTIVGAVVALGELPGLAPFVSVGIGMPGQAVPGTTVVAHALNLGIDELDVARAVGPRLALPVRVENDVKAAAVGAHALDGGRRDLAYLNLGTGVAAGLITDGRLWRGRRGTAGEVGHVSIDPQGPVCRCGARGCIEALAGGAAVAARWGRNVPLPVRDVFDAADAADPLAIRLREDLARAVAAAVRLLVLTADVDAVVLGGGVTALGERLLTDVRASLDAGAATSVFLRSLRLSERVELLPVGSSAAALGAAIVGGLADLARGNEGVEVGAAAVAVGCEGVAVGAESEGVVVGAEEERHHG